MNSFRKLLLKFAEYESIFDDLVIFSFLISHGQYYTLFFDRAKILPQNLEIKFFNKGVKNQKMFYNISNFDIQIRNASKWSSGYQRLGRFWAVSLSVVVHASSRAQRKDHLDPRWSPHAH